MNQPRSAPPALPGFTLVEGIGSGGFADVFLFAQNHPNRSVAVKVLRAEYVSDLTLRQFATEADVMAQVSAHPYIVTIYDSGIAPDGRPYIVMEHYPGDHFGIRARGGRLPVAEVLRVGVQVASAVETAHRAGILHRDIKPANILTSSYGRPGLTDFGIASVAVEGNAETAAGVTVAFSSPEVLLEQTTGTVASDIYSFAATLFSLLTGHSPFWVPGGDNTESSVMTRVMGSNPPRVGRAEVPPSLAHLLANAMATDPASRPLSALAFARALQSIEQELSLAPTAIEVLDDVGPAAARRPPAAPSTDEDDEGTRRPPRVVDPDPGRPPAPSIAPPAPPPAVAPRVATAPPTFVTPAPGPPAADERWAPTPPGTATPSTPPAPGVGAPAGVAEVEDEHHTVMKRPAPPPVVRTTAADDDDGAPTRAPVAVIGTIAVVAVALLGTIAYLTTRGDGGEPPGTTVTTRTTITLVTPRLLDPPTDIAATITPTGDLTITFVPAQADVSGLSFRINQSGGTWPDLGGGTGADKPEYLDRTETTVVIPGFAAGEIPCFTIATVEVGAAIGPDSRQVCARAAAADAAPTPPAETPTDPAPAESTP